MRPLALWLASCAAAGPLPSPPPHALPSLSPVFVAHTHNYACFRIPSAVQAPSGALLVFAEARSTCDDSSPLNDVVFSRSVDDGATWDAPTVVVSGFGHDDFRNPTAVFSSSGALLVQFVNATTAPWHTLQIVSHDEGVTWGAPLDPALGVADSFLPGPANGLLLSGSSPAPGRLVMCGTNYYDSTRAPAAPRGARVWFSDDAGAAGSWTSPAFFAANLSECAMAELGDGSLVINFRNEHRTDCRCRAQARSDDGGATWSAVAFVPDLIEPVCSAGLLELSHGRGLLFSNPASESKRVNMTVRRSMDGGLTWPDDVQIWPGGCAYSVLVPVGSTGEAAGVVFETMDATGYNSIVFALVPPFAARGPPAAVALLHSLAPSIEETP
jgi:sialidase-1